MVIGDVTVVAGGYRWCDSCCWWLEFFTVVADGYRWCDSCF